MATRSYANPGTCSHILYLLMDWTRIGITNRVRRADASTVPLLNTQQLAAASLLAALESLRSYKTTDPSFELEEQISTRLCTIIKGKGKWKAYTRRSTKKESRASRCSALQERKQALMAQLRAEKAAADSTVVLQHQRLPNR